MELKGKISTIVAVIVALIIAVTLIGTTASTVNTASASINISNRCAAAGCYYNHSAAACYNASAFLGACSDNVAAKTLPLEGLFNSGGIVVLLFIAAGIIVCVGLAMKMSKR